MFKNNHDNKMKMENDFFIINQSKMYQDRLYIFYLKNAPQFIPRIPYILDAYQENLDYLFGDLDHNFNTHESTKIEKKKWKKEDPIRKNIRINVAQSYIYRNLDIKKHYLSDEENNNYLKAKSLS